MLTTLGLSELLQSYMDLSIYEKIDKDVPKNIFGKISDFLVNDPKWLLLLLIPLFSYTTSKIFKSAKLNFGDHFLIHCYSISTINFVMTVFLLPLIFIESVSYYKLSASISIGFFVFSYFIFLYQFFRNYNVQSIAKSLIASVINIGVMLTLFILLALLEQIG